MTFTPPANAAEVTDASNDRLSFIAFPGFPDELRARLVQAAGTNTDDPAAYVRVGKDDARALGNWLIEWADK